MPVLSIDSSSEYSNLLIMDDNFNIISERIFDFHESGKEGGHERINRKPNHSVMIFRQLDDMLSASKLKLSDLSGIAVLLGPGSFTGVRVSLVVAKTFSYIYGLNIIGVGSLFACAYSFIKNDLSANYIAALKDAGRGDYYVSAWTIIDGGMIKYMKPNRFNAEEIKSFIDGLDGAVILVYGNGGESGYERIKADLQGTIEPLSFDLKKTPYIAAKYLLESGIKTDLKYARELSPVYVYSEGPF